MEGMKRYSDKYFDLAIVDPPYGLDMSQELYKRGISCEANGYKKHLDKDWDKQIPTQEYFNELSRVSKNQIVWGGNYFGLPIHKGWVVWNKIQRGFSFSDGELAWTSFDIALRIFDYGRGSESGFAPKSLDTDRPFVNIHPTQKPIALYKWLLTKYAKPNDKILDTHVGSASSLIACEDMGFDYVGFEIDKDYYEAACKRLEQFRSQFKLAM